VVRRAADLDIGDEIRVGLAAGSIGAVVTKVVSGEIEDTA
jgi:hypothetical protein